MKSRLPSYLGIISLIVLTGLYVFEIMGNIFFIVGVNLSWIYCFISLTQKELDKGKDSLFTSKLNTEKK